MATHDDRSKTPSPAGAGKPAARPATKPAAPSTAPSTTHAPPADNPYAQYYVVKKGDTLSKIAAEHYGDKMLFPKIFEANRDTLADPNKIKPGQKLRIP